MEHSPNIDSEGNTGLDGTSIVESNTDQFSTDVIEKSQKLPVLVDFWAPWCGPCKTLTPVIEKIVNEYQGRLALVKINVDENQALASQMRVQSIPMVVAFKDGAPVDGFAGALPESQLREFIDKLFEGEVSPLEKMVNEAGSFLENGDIAEAVRLYSQVVEVDPKNPLGHAGLIRAMMVENKTDEALNYIEALDAALKNSNEVSGLKAALELLESESNSEDLELLRQNLDNDPEDPDARYDLAVSLYGKGKVEESIDMLVELVKTHGQWNEDAARSQLLKIFEARGHLDEHTIEGRRKLSSVLFS
jgi:putative thioredoxin|tara:strand:+ start:426 stop:1340 length:915 start_codon:yes stop_codon:yes gene_type:complete